MAGRDLIAIDFRKQIAAVGDFVIERGELLGIRNGQTNHLAIIAIHAFRNVEVAVEAADALAYGPIHIDDGAHLLEYLAELFRFVVELVQSIERARQGATT